MPVERLFLVIQHEKQDGKKVWCCGVAGCEYSHAEAEAMETHISQQHTAECLAADLLWLNTRGEDVVPDHCACSFSRMFPSHGERAAWVRVSAVILNCCVEHLIKDVGPGAVYGLRTRSCDEKQEADLVAALERSPTQKIAAFCVACGLSICLECMGNKYFPNHIMEDKTPRTKNYTGFQVKATPPLRSFVCHDCAGDIERLKSAWIIRAWQKLLRALNGSPTWKMNTEMQLHRHDSLNAGRHIYTLEHVNLDFSGNKCGRCRSCFNPHHQQRCKSMATRYAVGDFVLGFDAQPDEKFSGDTDGEDDADNVEDDAPVAEASPLSFAQAEPFAQAERVETVEDCYKARFHQAQAERQALMAELDRVQRALTSERASKAGLIERAEIAEHCYSATLHELKNITTNFSKVGDIVRKEVQQAIKEIGTLLSSQLESHLEKRLARSEPTSEAMPACSVPEPGLLPQPVPTAEPVPDPKPVPDAASVSEAIDRKRKRETTDDANPWNAMIAEAVTSVNRERANAKTCATGLS